MSLDKNVAFSLNGQRQAIYVLLLVVVFSYTIIKREKNTKQIETVKVFYVMYVYLE